MSENSAVGTESDFRVVLSDAERNELAAIARELTQTPPALVDDEKWLAVAYRLAAAVPIRVRQELRRFQHDPGLDGVLLLSNLGLDDETLPQTPTRRGSVERDATLPAATQALIALCLGEMIAYQKEKDGALVQNVVPVQGQERTQSNAGSADLEMHVENAFHAHRPDYVMLMCLRSDHENRAGLLTGPLRRAFPHIPVKVREVLWQERFETEAPPSFVASGAKNLRHAVFSGASGDPNILVDFNATRPLDDEARDAMDVLKEHLAAAAQTFVLGSGDLAVVDNRITVHGRSEFVPRYDGRDRWLHRSFIHLDGRRSLGSRVGDSQVIA
ncbi:TauD/TfdA family dioxygenase [Actinoallomurus soli]|uniref:TauD/TfdA family dioxygenase n=1 Tax=Actinoallomurus soli TaxID=2952535 RepID=UPI002092D2F4|nr:TauD/TfdA family dioxygenase [Actinoallomurus soli]MCO5968363.1 TauD/TfdA family dioxygenase [Actinoallomurus soli]